MNSCYLGGKYKVNFTITSHNSFKYPSEQFSPIKVPVYDISWDKLGKRNKVSVRSRKQVIEVFTKLEVNPLKWKKLKEIL